MQAHLDPRRHAFGQCTGETPTNFVGGEDITLHTDAGAGRGDIRQHCLVQLITFNEQGKRPAPGLQQWYTGRGLIRRSNGIPAMTVSRIVFHL
ncbi:MAG TPA: hypothetical protein ENH21_00705, partial [Chromatiales bacterium]|nr:hypothetical protein [Chromatiales bacterium]HEX21932.1 hypothetical protein [Chromatiales bacterium]